MKRAAVAIATAIVIGGLAAFDHLLTWLEANASNVPDTIPEAWTRRG